MPYPAGAPVSPALSIWLLLYANMNGNSWNLIGLSTWPFLICSSHRGFPVGWRLGPAGRWLDSLGQTLDSLGQTVDSIGQRLDSPGQRVDSLGQTVDFPGQTLDSLGQTGLYRTEVTLHEVQGSSDGNGCQYSTGLHVYSFYCGSL